MPGEFYSPNPEATPELSIEDLVLQVSRVHRINRLEPFLSQFYRNDFWPHYAQWPRPVSDEEMAHARELAQLDVVDEIMRKVITIPDNNLRKKLKPPTRDQRIYVWVREQGKCYYCTANAHPKHGGFNPDHYIPFSHQGPSTIDNLVCSCTTCNIAKSQNHGHEFKRLLEHPNGLYYRNALFNERKGRPYKDEDIAMAYDIMSGAVL